MLKEVIKICYNLEQIYFLPFLPSSDMFMLNIIKITSLSGSLTSITHLILMISHVVNG